MTPSDKRTSGIVWFDHPELSGTTEQLSRDRIVAAAMSLADSEPGGDITMRAVAARLGVRSPMALYRYVGSKDGLLDLMVDEVYGRVTVPGGHGWRHALRGLGRSGWDAMQRHPWSAHLAYSRPPLGPNALNLYDTALGELDALDLDASPRMGFINTVLGHVLGSGLALLEERTMRARVDLPTDADLDKAVTPYLERVAAAGQHPHFTRWASDPRRHAPQPQSFEQILEWLLDGLQTLVDGDETAKDTSGV
ncbi:MAG: TetR/AcrR family transcriptional regulator [Nocardioidaceae bacterium]